MAEPILDPSPQKIPLKPENLKVNDQKLVLDLQQEVAQLRQENEKIVILYQEIERLKQENKDLKIMLQTMIEHGDAIEAILHQTDQDLQGALPENQNSSSSLFELVQKQKTDLEIVVQMLIEHGDMLDQQWNQKASEAQYLAEIDSLTQIANRRKFDQYLEFQWYQMLRQGDFLAVLLCDVDYFKQYNDTYGHPSGDRCLIQVAQTLQSVLKRHNDLLARYGGEEFAVILPQTNLAGAHQVAEQILTEINSLKIPHCQSPISPYVTMSIGLASMVPHAQSSRQVLVNQADRFLYLAKHQGRNQIVYQDIYDEGHPSPQPAALPPRQHST